jgi:hypothetical protein
MVIGSIQRRLPEPPSFHRLRGSGGETYVTGSTWDVNFRLQAFRHSEASAASFSRPIATGWVEDLPSGESVAHYKIRVGLTTLVCLFGFLLGLALLAVGVSGVPHPAVYIEGGGTAVAFALIGFLAPMPDAVRNGTYLEQWILEGSAT